MMIDLTSRLVGLRLVWSWWSSFGAIARRYFKLLMSSYDVSALVGFWLPVRIILRRMFRIVWRDCLWVVFSFRSFFGVLFWFTVFGLCLLIDFHVQKIFMNLISIVLASQWTSHKTSHRWYGWSLTSVGDFWNNAYIVTRNSLIRSSTHWLAFYRIRSWLELPFVLFHDTLGFRVYFMFYQVSIMLKAFGILDFIFSLLHGCWKKFFYVICKFNLKSDLLLIFRLRFLWSFFLFFFFPYFYDFF